MWKNVKFQNICGLKQRVFLTFILEVVLVLCLNCKAQFLEKFKIK